MPIWINVVTSFYVRGQSENVVRGSGVAEKITGNAQHLDHFRLGTHIVSTAAP